MKTKKIYSIISVLVIISALMFAFMGPAKAPGSSTEHHDGYSNAAGSNEISTVSMTAPAALNEQMTSASTAATLTEATAEAATEIMDTSVDNEWIYRGSMYDRDLNVLIYNKEQYRCIAEPFNISHGNLLDSYNSWLSVDRAFEELMRRKNPTTLRQDGHLIGQSLVLTIDSEIHDKIYRYMEANNIVGSVTVLDADGKVEALVSYPSYDANADFTTLDLGPAACINRCVSPVTPGSAFKILSGVIATRAHWDTTLDKGYIAEFDISNWDCNGVPYPEPIPRNVDDAIRNSSNCWFADLFYRSGAESISTWLDEYFCYSKPIQCDFTTLSNSIQLDTPSNLARAGFGQREKVTPLYLAMAANAVATDELNVPYIADRLIDSVTLKDIEQLGKKITLVKMPAEKQLTEGVLLGMSGVTEDLGLKAEEGRKLYTKTGTAEVSDDESVNDIHYIVTVCTDEGFNVDNTRTVVFQRMNSDFAYAAGDKEYMQAILDIAESNR